MNEGDMVKGPDRFRWLVLGILLAGALGLYGATMCWGAFPGLPAKSLAWHLWLDAFPTLLDGLWGRLVRVCAALPGGNVAGWMGGLSALFGAGCVAGLAALMMRVRYPMHDAHDPDEVQREAQARLLAGVTSGLFAMFSVPFWVMSTRSLPGTFHLFMLLGAVWLFSEYQRTGRAALLYFLGLLYGVGLTEFTTFWVMAPMAAILVIRAMLVRAELSWTVLVRVGLCLIPGLLFYVWNGWTLWTDSAVALRGFESMGTVIWYIWRDQWNQVVGGPFLIVAFLSSAPWGVLFLLRAKKPAWRYSAWQVILRLVVLSVALFALFYLDLHQVLKMVAPSFAGNLPSIGLFYPLGTPYLILAACAGYVAGEFWVMGQMREHRNAGIGHPLRRAMGMVGILLPLVAVAAGIRNGPVADGRPGRVMDEMANVVLDGLKGRDVLLSNAAMDDNVGLMGRRRNLPLVVISLPQTGSSIYRKYLAGIFQGTRQQALLQVGFGAFLQDFLGRDEGLQRVASLDEADALREFGYLVPDRLVFRAEASPEQIDWPALVESQKLFWMRMEGLAAAAVDPRNPAHGYHQYLLRLASKVANNIGFAQLEQGDVDGAMDSFHQARRLHPDNISALLNLWTIAQTKELPEAKEYEAEWEAFKERQMDSRVMWALGALHGYVHNTGYLVRQGMMWAVSGKPRMAEAELRRASGSQEVSSEVKAFLARAYLQSGEHQRSSEFYREILKENPQDQKSLLMLAEIAMGAGEIAEAERLLARAEEAGIPPDRIQFERAILAYLKGQGDVALASLKALVKREKNHIQAWSLLALLTADGRDAETYEQALKAIRDQRGTNPDVRLMLAELSMGRKEWGEARAELEQVTRMNPRHIRAWELLATVDFQERKRELAEDHVRVLLTLDPGNYTGNLLLGSFQYARGQHALAESSYRAALEAKRDPVALNDLAYLLLMKGEDLEEALALVNEALGLVPGSPLFLSTRSEILVQLGQLDDAEKDLQQVLAAWPDHAQALLLSARLYAARDQKAAALELAEALAGRMNELPVEKQGQLQDLLRQLR